MYKYNKILVGLDHTDMDLDLIKAASDICALSGSIEVFFFNIIKDFNLPDNLQKEFPHLLDHAIEERRLEIQEKVEQNFDQDKTKIVVHVIVQQGQAAKTLLNFTAREKIDLVVLGRKIKKTNGKVLIHRVARKAGCSLLIIPQRSVFRLDRILVPTDFSDYSKKAMEKALTLSRRSGQASKIIVQNVYQVPVGYHYTGKSFDEFSEVMKANAEKDYLKFMSTMKVKGVEIEQVYTLDKDEDIIADIYKTAKKVKASIIVIGAKGRSGTTAFFIGSKAERLIHLDSEIPMLVVRPKGKRAGILEYIQEL